MGEVQFGQIPFSASEDKSATELGGAAPTVVNAIPDASGAARRRPGIKAWSVFPSASASGSPVIGMLPWGEQLVYVTADRKIHAVSSGGGVSELSDSSVLTQLDGGSRPSMVAGRELFVLAGAGAIQKWTGSGLSARLTNTGAGGDPPQSTFLCAIGQRLVASLVGTSGQIWWTGPLEEYENWDMATGGASYIQAGAKPDPIKAMYDNTNEVFCFGPETIQVFCPAFLQVDANDPDNVLDFAPNRTENIGTISPYSIIPMDDMFGLVDRQRRIIVTDGRTYNDISKNETQALRDMATVEDAWGFRMRFGRFDCLVWMFPTAGYGLIWDATANTWGQWRAGGVAEGPLTITSAYNWAEQNVFLVGLSDGSIAQLDDATYTDLGEPISVELVSGFVNHGSGAVKHCKCVLFAFKRTWAAIPAVSPGLSASGHVRISYRDDQGIWKILKDLELSTDSEVVVPIRSVGVYRTRQWRVQYTGADELQLVSAQEEFEILGA
jgi:hypothetical protein